MWSSLSLSAIYALHLLENLYDFAGGKALDQWFIAVGSSLHQLIYVLFSDYDFVYEHCYVLYVKQRVVSVHLKTNWLSKQSLMQEYH